MDDLSIMSWGCKEGQAHKISMAWGDTGEKCLLDISNMTRQ